VRKKKLKPKKNASGISRTGAAAKYILNLINMTPSKIIHRCPSFSAQ